MWLTPLLRAVVFGVTLVVIPPHLCGEIHILAIVSSANYVPGRPDPGSLATAFCTGITGIEGVVTAKGTPLPTLLAGVTVYVGGVPAPLLAVADLGGYQQINFQIPWEADTLSSRTVDVLQGVYNRGIYEGGSYEQWGAFFVDRSGYVVAQHAADYQTVTPDHPARPGEWVVIYASNLGPVLNTPPNGVPASLDPLSPLAPNVPWPNTGISVSTQHKLLMIRLDGVVTTESNFMGLAPGTIGIYQINFRVPDDYPVGEAQLEIERTRFCGFFYLQGCGRGIVTRTSLTAKLPIGP